MRFAPKLGKGWGLGVYAVEVSIWVCHMEHTNSIKNLHVWHWPMWHWNTSAPMLNQMQLSVSVSGAGGVLRFHLIKCCKWKQYLQNNYLPSIRQLQQHDTTRPLVQVVSWLPRKELHQEVQSLLWVSRVSLTAEATERRVQQRRLSKGLESHSQPQR